MKPSFTDLKAAYPYNPPARTDRTPCTKPDGSPSFANQCAIRLGVALRATGVLGLAGAPGVVSCWFHPRSAGHTLRAEELANWLARGTVFGAPTKLKGAGAATDLQGKQGVVFVKDFYGPGNSGDHIDIWDVDHMLSGSTTYFDKARAVWFWSLTAGTT